MTRGMFVQAMEEILGVPKKSLREQDNRTTLSQWTSLADVQLFALISDEFGIEPDDELIQAESLGDLLRILDSRGAFATGVTC